LVPVKLFQENNGVRNYLLGGGDGDGERGGGRGVRGGGGGE